MARRYGSADAEERRINVGRTTPTQPTQPSSGSTRVRSGMPAALDMYEGQLPWKEIASGNQDFINAAKEWDALAVKPEGIDKWSWIYHNAQAGRRAANTTANELNNPFGGSGGGGGGNAPLMSTLRSLVAGMGGGGNATDITSGYGGLMGGARENAAAQRALIDQYFGGEEGRAQTRLNETLARLQSLIGGARSELDTQTAEGRQRIDETTQRTLNMLAGQQNPFASLQAVSAPVAESPLMANLQALGQNTQGLSALQNMFTSDAAANRNAMQDMINMMAASETAGQQGRRLDVEAARGGAQQDLAAAQRAAAQLLTNQSLQGEQAARDAFDQAMSGLGQSALQARLGVGNQLSDVLNQLGLGQLQATLQDRQSQQARRDAMAEQLLALAGEGIDVSGLMRQLLGA